MAISLFLLFLFFAIFMRIIIQWYKTKDWGVRLARPNSPLIEIIPGTVFIISLFASFVLVVLSELKIVSATANLNIFLSRVFFIIGLFGILIIIISQYQMGDSWRIGVDKTERTLLKKGGIYALSRNPIYTGILIFLIGVNGVFIHPLLCFFSLICWCSIELIVRKLEEPYLHKMHQKEYADYMKNTNRYIPCLVKSNK